MSRGNDDTTLWFYKVLLLNTPQLRLKERLLEHINDLAYECEKHCADYNMKAVVKNRNKSAYGPSDSGLYIITIGLTLNSKVYVDLILSESIMPEATFHRLANSPEWIRNLTRKDSIL